MTFSRYRTYEDTGVKWLGEKPQHWYATRLGFLCEKIGSGKTPSGGSESYVQEGVPFIRSQNVKDGDLDLSDVAFINQAVDEEMRATRVQSGDILLNITGASLGRTCIVADDVGRANVSQHVCIIRLIDPSIREFMAFSMRSERVKGQIQAALTGAAREGLNFSQISKLLIVLPPPKERELIARFLRKEMTKLDVLIADQRRLLELLQEKRKAVVSHAVTKGFNLFAPMKPSGIEWLGEVPAHWKIKRLRHCAVGVYTGTTPSTGAPLVGENGDIPWYTPGDFDESIVLGGAARKYSMHDSEFDKLRLFPVNSILVVGIGATLGRVGLTTKLSSANQQINAIVAAPGISGQFLAYSLSAKSDVMRYLSNSSTIGILNQEKTKEIWLTVPPYKEQLAIQSRIDATVKKVDNLADQVQQAMALLEERRSALISATVTGQIDVLDALEARKHDIA